MAPVDVGISVAAKRLFDAIALAEPDCRLPLLEAGGFALAQSLPQGMLNHVYLGRLYPNDWLSVVRFPRTDQESAVRQYWRRLVLGLRAEGHRIRLLRLTPTQQVGQLAKWELAGMAVPAVVSAGSQWMHYQFCPGITLREYLGNGGPLSVLDEFLSRLVRLHESGAHAFDRWGGNDLVDEGGRLVHIDPDLQLAGPDDLVRALDLVTAVFGWIRAAREPELVVEWFQGTQGITIPSDLYSTSTLRDVVDSLAGGYLTLDQTTGRDSQPALDYLRRAFDLDSAT